MVLADTRSGPPRPHRAAIANLAIAGASVLVGLLGLEGLLRVLASGDNVYATATLNIYAPDRDLGWRLSADVRRQVRWLGRSIVVCTDTSGHRVPDGAPTTVDGPALVFAGDSYTFGNEVEAQETFAWQSGRLLGVPVVNLGVGGYSLDQACLSLERYVSQPHPAVLRGVLAVFIGNDIEYGAAPARPTYVDPEGYLVQSPASAAARGLVARSRAFFLVFKAREAVRSRWMRWRDERTVSYRWIYDENAWGPGVLDSHRQSLVRLLGIARAANVPLTVLLLPERDQVYGSFSDLPNRRLVALFHSLEIPALDLLPALRVAAVSDPDLYHNAPAGHLSPSGHALVAAVLSAHLSAAPVPNKRRRE